MSLEHGAIIVSSLVCHAHVEMAVDCLGSVVRHCAEPIRLQIHDDGSLTDCDIERLQTIGKLCVIRRAEADERMEEELLRFPACRALRKELPLALKLFDTFWFHPGPVYAFVDSDVLFLKRFADPFSLNGETANAVFMDDRQHSYSVRSWRLLLTAGIRLPARVNTGIVVFRKSCFDLELIEWFLSHPASRGVLPMREQTSWALLGQRMGCRKFDPCQVRVMRANEDESKLVAGHFTARTRTLLPSYVMKSKAETASNKAVSLTTIEGGHCSALDVALFEGQRVLQKLKVLR